MLDETRGRKIQDQILMCCEMELNTRILATKESILSLARDINSTREWPVMLVKLDSTGEDSVYPLQLNTTETHQPNFDSCICYKKCFPCVGEDSGGETWQFNTAKKYTLFVIFMGDG